jgi:hypothetical protein
MLVQIDKTRNNLIPHGCLHLPNCRFSGVRRDHLIPSILRLSFSDQNAGGHLIE